MAYNVLVVDDEPQIHTFIRISLVAEGYQYSGAQTVESAWQAFVKQQPDVVILDLGLPDGDGLELLQRIRQHSQVPVLILTARDEEEEKIRLLEGGANDYLSKPFGIRELMVRIKVLVRDLVVPRNPDKIECGRLSIQVSSHQMWLDGRELVLTKKEFAFLAMLARYPNQLVKQSDLLHDIWGPTHVNDSHYLRILVSQLRRKLDDSADNQLLIKTESGLGYRLVNHSQ